MRTIAEAAACEKEMLTVADIAPILMTDPQSIRLQAKKDPKALGFPCIVVGTRTLIPREGFVRFCRALNIEG